MSAGAVDHGRLPDLAGLCVLVIDDNDDARATIAATLHYAGATMTSAAAGDHALDDLTQFLPDVIICDLRMPRLDGLAFMRRLRARPPGEGGEIPVVAITAYHEEYSLAEALGAGFAAYLRKPLDLGELCRVVRCVGRRPPGPAEPPGPPVR
jgi:CheY-like chemotaxis protein